MRAADDPWREERSQGLLGDFCSSFCNSISSCLYLVCCCWLLQDCLPSLRRPAHYRNHPPGPSGHHPRPTDPLVGPGPAPSRFGTPGGPPGVPNPLTGPMGEDPARFEPPGPPVPPGGRPGVPGPLAGPMGEDPARFEPPGPPVPPGPRRY